MPPPFPTRMADMLKMRLPKKNFPANASNRVP